MGNSTRCHAVIEILAERGIRVHVLTSGNGLGYFANRPEVHTLATTREFRYAGDGERISGWRTAATLTDQYAVLRAKRDDMENLLQRIPIQLVVTDSEYATAPARRRNIPVLGLNNADSVVSGYFKLAVRPSDIRGHFWLVEYADYLFHRFRRDLVISPSPQPAPARHPRIRKVGLIIRRSVRELAPGHRVKFPAPADVRKVACVLSGSGFASPIPFGEAPACMQIDVVGREGPSTGNLRFHGKLMDNSALLKNADALIVNGGYSSVSEAIALRKPSFVIPLPGHAEQFINAGMVEELGLGYRVTADSVMTVLRQLHERNSWEGLRPQAEYIDLDGAEEAADIICDTLAGRGGPGTRRQPQMR